MLDTLSLGRRPGSMRTVQRRVLSPSRIGLEMIAIEEGSEIDLDLRLESVSEGVLVTGTVRADTAGECSRCLEPFTGEVSLYLTELFAYPNSVTDQTTQEDEVYRIEDDLIDLEPAIVDAVGLELPLRPLCTDDCAGLCAECGIRLAIAESGHGHEILDPRWAGLAAAFGAGSEESSSASDSKNNEEK
ncbi:MULTISPECIES: YceD family protein [unclassified Rhodococcus (in: high G+C Gram-positive bacteria)]|uniref:YceD family protein n=1 Tax=Rhodococcus sp. SJ-3 TaxID=3454628 RepID=UPI003F795564